MTLKEMAAGYRIASGLVSTKIDVRRAEGATQTEINRLKSLNRELRKVAEICERYYERGYWLDDKYTCNTGGHSRSAGRVQPGKRGNKQRTKGKAQAKPQNRNPGGSDTQAAGDAASAILREMLGR